MGHISELLNVSSLSVKKEEKIDNVLNPHVTDIINKLFGFFFCICRGFEKQYEDPKRLNMEKTQWVKAFMDVGLNSMEKIKFGIKRCRLESPINTPTIAVFIKWCTPDPESVGLPHVLEAYKISLLISELFSTYKHLCSITDKIIRHSVDQIGKREYREMTSEKSRKIFEHYYKVTCDQYMSGEFKEINKAIEDQTVETKELKKQSEIVFPQYSGRPYEMCIRDIKEKLGRGADEPWPSLQQ